MRSAIGLMSPPALSAVRSSTGISSALAARTFCCILGLLLDWFVVGRSRTDNALARGVHPEHDAALQRADHRMQADADRRQDDQDRESAGHVEVEVLLQDEV